MALKVINNIAWDPRQKESESFGKICFIPSLGLSCFGCCGHHFKDKATMHRFFDSNKKTLAKYRAVGKSYADFMNREHLVDSCGGCYSLVREQDAQGRDQYLCGVHPLKIGGQDIRPGYCDHDYLCHTASLVNRMAESEKALFLEFLRDQAFDSFTYSMINSRETLLNDLYVEWKAMRERGEPGRKIAFALRPEL